MSSYPNNDPQRENVSQEPVEHTADENVSQEPVKHSSAEETASKSKKVIGRPITKETAKQYQLSAARAKSLRKQARARMLSALTERLDLGDELLKAMKGKDDKYLSMIERATRLVGLQHDQSPEAIAQKLEVKSDTTVAQKRDIVINFRKATPEDAQ